MANHRLDVLETAVNNGISTTNQPQLVNAGFLNHEQYLQKLGFGKKTLRKDTDQVYLLIIGPSLGPW